MPDDQRVLGINPSMSRLSRRHFLAGAAASTSALTLAGTTVALSQSDPADPSGFPPYGTPVTEVDGAVRLEDFRALCQRLAGIGDEADVSDETLQQLLDLLLQEKGDEEGAVPDGLRELFATSGDSINRDSLSLAANRTLTNILSFLFLGEFNGVPVENRADLYPGLVAYQVLPYWTTPAICKGVDYWTEDPGLPDRS